MSEHSEIKKWYIETFDRFEQSLNGQKDHAMHAVRRQALSDFAASEFPTTRDEEWKYTNVSPILKHRFSPVLQPGSTSVTAQAVEPFLLHTLDCHVVVFVNGHYEPALSRNAELPDAVEIGSLSAALKEKPDLVEKYLGKCARHETDAFMALNTAFAREGGFVFVPDNTIVDKPIHLLHVAAETAGEFVVYPRHLLLAGANSRVTVVESYESLSNHRYFTNVVSEVITRENAVIDHYKLQNESERAYHISTMDVQMQGRSRFVSNIISLGGALVRNNVDVTLDGESIEASVNGAYLVTDDQHVDNRTVMDHAKPNCVSNQLFKGILGGKSRGIFNGKVIVRKNAQKTNAYQTNNNVLLSDLATVDTKPQLEIFADDVKCSHGATVGQLDEEAMFYLRSRGIGEFNARSILLKAFVNDFIEFASDEALKARLEKMLMERLERFTNQG